jgi:signal transduction histidine kinase
MHHLHQLLHDCKEALIDGATQASLQPEPDDEGVRRELRSFLEGLIVALREPDAKPAVPAPKGNGEILGSDAGAKPDTLKMIRAYGGLHQSILELAAERSIEVNLGAQLCFVSSINRAILQTVMAYQERHERELHRSAHQLRNPLGSATMALTLLRSRTDLGDNVRLAEMMERNLQRLQGLIDEAVDRGRVDSAQPAPR